MIPFESLVLLEINLSKFTVIDHKLEDKLRPKLVAKDFDSRHTVKWLEQVDLNYGPGSAVNSIPICVLNYEFDSSTLKSQVTSVKA